jgi:hypothetical protein
MVYLYINKYIYLKNTAYMSYTLTYTVKERDQEGKSFLMRA